MKIGVLLRLHVATYTCLYTLVHSKINLLGFLIGLKNWFQMVEATMAQYCFITQVIIIPSKMSFVVKVLIVSKVFVWNITHIRYDFVHKSLSSYKQFFTVFNFVYCVETFTSNHTLQISIKLSGLSIVFNELSCLIKKNVDYYKCVWLWNIIEFHAKNMVDLFANVWFTFGHGLAKNQCESELKIP